MHNELYIALGKFVVIIFTFIFTGIILYLLLSLMAAIHGLVNNIARFVNKWRKREILLWIRLNIPH